MEQISSVDERLLLRPAWRARLRRWLFTIIILFFGGWLVRMVYHYWRGKGRASEKVVVVSRPTSGGKPVVILSEQPDYNFSRMVVLMDEYARLAAQPGSRIFRGKVRLEQMKSLLSDLLEERELYAEYLEREHRSTTSFETRRSKKATLHYMRSMENAIADLQRLIRENRPN
jgi:hypothetical protein